MTFKIDDIIDTDDFWTAPMGSTRTVMRFGQEVVQTLKYRSKRRSDEEMRAAFPEFFTYMDTILDARLELTPPHGEPC
jgi:hypothetical protein